MPTTVTHRPALTLVPPLSAPSKRYPNMFTAIAARIHAIGAGLEVIPPLFAGCALAEEYTQRTTAALAMQRAYLTELASPWPA